MDGGYLLKGKYLKDVQKRLKKAKRESDNVLRPEMVERVAKEMLDFTGRTMSRGTITGLEGD